jgi:uridylate kinase
MKMETTVISLGGSLIVPAEIDVGFLRAFKAVALSYAEQNRLVVVCGGGMVCRLYQAAAKQVTGPSDDDLDWIGIRSTKLNAELVRVMFGQAAHDAVADNPLAKIKTKKRIIIGSGYVPGSSSDKDAVLLAKNFGAKRVINLTNTDYVFDKDPRFYPDAKPIEKISWREFFDIIGDAWKPGANWPFDPTASREAERLGIKVIVVNGKNLRNLSECLYGKEFKGTVIG